MTEDEKPDERVHIEHWAQPYDSRAAAPGGAPAKEYIVWAEFAIGRAERRVPDGQEALRQMNRWSDRGASRVGYGPA